MNKEELLKQYDEKAKALRDEFISKLEDDKKEFELTYPKDGGAVYFIHRGDKSITKSQFWSDSTIDKNYFKMGEYFNTEDEAEQHLKERKLLFKLQQWAKIKNDGWEPDWEKENKYYIFYDYSCCEFETISTVISNSFKKLPYFKTREIAQACIDEFGEEIKEVLC
ncbi:hypothetical protein [uncultured Gemella sp.]|uniref:hypothetical protein n=1 Tax=uncultured Gemella sp. TaxID=254352 RepID=UPI0028D3F15E|nr:hypothetical protein [uncultured Gemella sp.]